MPDNNAMFNLDPKAKVVETQELRICGHLLRWSDTVIQISNISMVSTADLPVPQFPVASILMFIVGVFMLASDSRSYYHNELIQMASLILIMVAIGLVVLWAIVHEKNNGKTYLNLALNSGNVYSFLFTNKDFMRQVLQVFANIFESDPTQDAAVTAIGAGNATVTSIGALTINMQGNTITDSSGSVITVALK